MATKNKGRLNTKQIIYCAPPATQEACPYYSHALPPVPSTQIRATTNSFANTRLPPFFMSFILWKPSL